MEWMDHAIRKHADLKDRFPIIHTGFLELDSMAPLLRRGTVSLLGSRPGMGRSTLAAQIAANIADSGGYVVWFTTVLSVGEIVEKILRVKPDFQCPQNIALEDRVGDGRELQQAVMELGQRIDLVVVDDLQGMPITGKVVFAAMAPARCAAIPAAAIIAPKPFLRALHAKSRASFGVLCAE